MERIRLNTYETNPDWNSLEIKSNGETWGISSYTDGEVEIECHYGNGSEHLILNQDELRVLIDFLQTKLR